jgi:DNA mismatch repair ATPase MutL
VAVTELVANSWDAGASKVNIRIPDKKKRIAGD